MQHLELIYPSLLVCNPLPRPFCYSLWRSVLTLSPLSQCMISFFGDSFLERQGLILNVFEYQEGINQYRLILSSDDFTGFEFSFILFLLCILGTEFNTRIMEYY